MPVLFTKTDTRCDAVVGSATFRGNVWNVRPPYVRPPSIEDVVSGDDTDEGATYRSDTADMVEPCNVWLDIVAATYERFKPATTNTYPAGVHDVSAQPPVPLQTFSEEHGTVGRPGGPPLPNVGPYNWPGQGTIEREDAGGRLSVFAPTTGTDHPVLFWIRGGAWTVYHRLAAQQWAAFMAAYFNIVVVLPEYRLSTFGNFPHPALIEGGETSLAYTDLKEQLRWARNNIAAFGGDVDRITVGGTSAGGAATILFMEDDNVQDWIFAFAPDSGGGSAPYLTDAFFGPRVANYERSIRLFAPRLTSLDPQYHTIQDALDDGRDVEWIWQNAVRPEHVQAMADIGPTVTAQSVRNVLAGTGDLVASRRAEPENFYPFRRGVYASGIAMARAGKIRKPTIISYAECEALNLLGSDYSTIRDTLRNLPTSTLDGWAQRLGYASYAAWKLGDWIVDDADGDLQNLPGAQFNTSIDALAADCENRRVLYTHAVFGYPAWRMARAAAETASADVWLVVNNFSANSIWAGHSQWVPLLFGTVEWTVGGVVNFPDATPPGEYANVRMDVLYVALGIVMPKMARFCATGDPEGAYSSGPGFTLLTGNPPNIPGIGVTVPGAYPGTWEAYDMLEGGHHNILGKWFAPYMQNAGAFLPNGAIDLASQRDARTTYDNYMGAAYLEYLSLLEPE